MSFLGLCGWGAGIFLAFVGYGRCVQRLTGLAGSGWALAGALGVSLLTALGGCLNLGAMIVRPVLIPIVLLGDVLLFMQLLKPFRIRFDEPVLLTLLIVLLSVPVFGNIHPDVRSFNFYDDLPAYLTLPAETLQLGTLPADPFNERRVTSCLGAPYFLQSLMLVFGDVRSIRFIDVAAGSVLYAGLLFVIFRKLKLSTRTALFLTLLMFAAPVYRLNATMVVLPAALFCALFLVMMEGGSGVLLGLTAAALCALKSNYLPAAILICGFYYAGRFLLERHWRPVVQGVLCGAVVLLCLLPWMIDLHRKEGTYLFPILGRGYDASAYGVLPMPNGSHHVSSARLWVWITTLCYAGPMLAAFLVVLFAYWKKVEASVVAAPAALLLGSGFAMAVIASSTGGESLGRYSLPFQVPALLVFLALLLRWRQQLGANPFWLKASLGLAAACLLFLAGLFGIHHKQYRTYLEDARLATPRPEGWFDMGTEERRVHDLQARVPPGELMLARLFVTYPFDFRRNRISVADYTGMAGPAPGMPITGGPDAMRQYLLSNGIRYLAYDSKRTSFPDEDPATTVAQLLQNPEKYGRHGWIAMQVKVSNHEQRTFAEMAETCTRLYDDGQVYVLDLTRADGARKP